MNPVLSRRHWIKLRVADKTKLNIEEDDAQYRKTRRPRELHLLGKIRIPDSAAGSVSYLVSRAALVGENREVYRWCCRPRIDETALYTHQPLQRPSDSVDYLTATWVAGSKANSAGSNRALEAGDPKKRSRGSTGEDGKVGLHI